MSEKLFIEDLCFDTPDVEDVVGVVKLHITITKDNNGKEEKYVTPLFHFMVYKKQPISKEYDYAYECACLELGQFHVLASSKKKQEEKIAIKQLIIETSDIVAEHIRLNVFEHQSDLPFKQIQSDVMDEYWRIYRIFNLLRERNCSLTDEKIHQVETNEIENITKELSSNRNDKREGSFSDFLKKIAV